MTRIFLIGLMGSGKTYWAKKIAAALHWKFADLDGFIEEREQMSITEIFGRFGENHFRLLEKKYLEELSRENKIVVAAGGGTPCFHNNMEVMNKTGETWYLKVEPALAAQRLKDISRERPLLKNKTGKELAQFLTSQLQRRERFYLQAKHIVEEEKLDGKKLTEVFGQAHQVR